MKLYIVPLFLFDGADSDFQYWRVQSRSRYGLWHDIHVSKRDGWAECGCEDCSYRRKLAHILEPGGEGGCWHLQFLITHCYQRQGLQLMVHPDYGREDTPINIGLAA